MFENKQYTLRTETSDGTTRYYVSFIDGEGNFHDTKVLRPVYKEFLRFVIIEQSLRHWDERHREYSELTDEGLYNRTVFKPKSLEDTVIDEIENEHLKTAVQHLSELQQRRFVLHYEFELTYEQIAVIEGCSFQAVAKSIEVAKKNIRAFLEKIEN